ncbi:hypothetical protein EDD85DRAFT_739063, partial [Armillaria nabsnona]
PSHVYVNIFDGRPRFIRVRFSDKCTIVLPDFYGNCIVTVIETIEPIPLVSLT